MPKVWNMTCICCRSVFHLSHYVTKLVSSAAASWVHRVKSLKYGKVTSGLCTPSERRWADCKESLVLVNTHLSHAGFSMLGLLCLLWSFSHLEMDQHEADNVLWATAHAGFGTGAFRNHPHQQGQCLIPRVQPISKCHGILALVSQRFWWSYNTTSL